MTECYFTPDKKGTSATICANCGKEKCIHSIGDGIKATTLIIQTQPITDKQPQTCYVECKVIESDSVIQFIDETIVPSKKIESVYIHTHEELEALKAKWMREAAESSFDAGRRLGFAEGADIENFTDAADKDEYLDQHYPLPTNKH